MTDITVVIPTYNGINFLPNAVESVLTQDDVLWKLIIADDGSTDGTREYLSTITDKRITVFFHEKNLGIFGNLNFLLRTSTTEIVKIICQDDKLLPNALLKIYLFMKDRPTCAVSRCLSKGDKARFGPSTRHGLEGSLPEYLNPAASILAFATYGNIVGNLCRASCRPNLVLSGVQFDQSLPYAGDFDGWLRVSERHGIFLQAEELVFEGRHPMQNSNLLNLKNELYPQLDRILEYLETRISVIDIDALYEHWRIHFYPPRLSKYFRTLLIGKFSSAAAIYRSSRIKKPILNSVWKYMSWKKFDRSARRTLQTLHARILQENSKT